VKTLVTILLLAAVALHASVAKADAGFEWTGAHVAGTQLEGLSCPSPSLCVAVGYDGGIVDSTTPSDGTSWKAWPHVDTQPYAGFGTVACPTTSLCVAGDDHGDLFATTTPTDGTSWRVRHVVGGSGGAFGTPILAISCPSASFCVAADGDSDVLTSAQPASGTWQVAQIVSEGPIEQMSCPSASLCVATDSWGNVLWSTDPAGGASAWHPVDGLKAGPVTCPSTSLCLMGQDSNILWTTNPTGDASAWTAIAATQIPVKHLACGSTGQCVGTDALDRPFSSSSPTTTWSSGASLTALGNVYALSCPSATLCFASDGGGYVWTGVPITPPAATTPPAITGTPQVGQTLTGTHGTWTGHRLLYVDSWEDCDAAGANCVARGIGLSRTVTAADLGHTLRLRETATGTEGSGTAESAPTAVVPGAPGPGGGSPQIITPPLPAKLALSIAAPKKLKAGRYSMAFTAPGAGTLKVAWYLKKKLIAGGRATAKQAGAGHVTLELTAAGRRQLARARRLKLPARATITPSGGAAVTATRTFSLKR
jgi:hypothetical protein